MLTIYHVGGRISPHNSHQFKFTSSNFSWIDNQYVGLGKGVVAMRKLLGIGAFIAGFIGYSQIHMYLI